MKDLTKGNILSNLVKLSLPIMFSNFMQTVYNLTDAFWLGKLPNAKEAVSVVGIAYPLVFFLSSFGAGFVVAGTTLVGQYKGQNRTDELKKIAGQFIFIFIAFTTVFISIATIFMEPILLFLNTPPEILSDTKDYIRIIMIGMAAMYFFMFYESFSFGLGDSFNPMKINIASVLLNLILDPFFIFGFKIIPSMEILGAAYATLLSRIVSVILCSIVFTRKYKFMLPSLKEIFPNKPLLAKILKISIPESISRSMTSFGFFILQGFVNSFGTVVISVYSVGLRITNIFMMPAFGISSALASIIAQNLGAKNIERVEKTIKIAFRYINTIMFIGCGTLVLFGGNIMSVFIHDPQVIEAATRMYRITPYATFMFGMIFVYNGIFNAAGYTHYNMILSLIRLWIIRIPLTIILSKFITPYPYEALWWAMIFSNTFNLIGSRIIFKKNKWKTPRIR